MKLRLPCVALLLTAFVWNASASEVLPDLRVATREMVTAAQAFWNALTPEQQAKAGFPMNGDERLNWHFIPKTRNGLSLKEMQPAQRLLANAFFISGMSQRGYMDAVSIMSLEQILYDMENKSPKRDPEMYHFSIFGTPDEKKPWGWRVEGHHLSINFTLVSGVFVTAAPNFYGTNPQLVKEGPRKGLRVLAKEEDLGRALMLSLNEEQKKTAVIAAEAFKDVVTGADKKVNIGEPKGLPAEKMTEAQKTALAELIKHYAARARAEIAKSEWERIEKAGFDKVHFGWAGVTEVGGPHYYRIHGPTFLVEYDNVQNGANHVHAVWRDPANDFGGDVLAKHYADNPHDKQ